MSPVFAHGQLRLYLLALLTDGPRHGYDLIRDLEETFNGLYTPSAGTIYPRLAKLEDEGLIERLDEGRKAPYRLTAAGAAEVAARRGEIDDIKLDIDHSVHDLAEEVRQRVSSETTDLRAELKAAAKAARASARAVNTSAARDARSSQRGGQSAIAELEQAVNEFRAEARHQWRTAKVTVDQARTIAGILAAAARDIQQVVEGKPARGGDGCG